MKKITTKTKFETEDGRKFTDQKAAETHEQIQAAATAYEQAREAFGRVLAESQRTADGFPFEFGLSDYYYIALWGGLPTIRRVDFWYRNWSFDYDRENEPAKFCLLHFEGDGGRCGNGQPFRIGDLYRHRANAERALVEAQEKWLAEETERVAEARAKLPNAR